MPRTQQHDAHKRTPHSELIGNFVVTHVRVIPHHQRHARSRSHFAERPAYFLAGALFDQFFELAGLRVLQGERVDVLGLFILAYFPAPQRIPAVVRRHAVQPSRKRPFLVVLGQLALP